MADLIVKCLLKYRGRGLQPQIPALYQSGYIGIEMKSRSRSLNSSRVLNIGDLRTLARRRVPRVVFDYIDGGAAGEITLRENLGAFDEVTFRPHNAVASTDCDLRTRVLGLDLAMPVLLAPVGYCRVMHPDGEAGAARAAGNAGVGSILSTVSGYSLEAVKAAATGPLWYQLYLTGGRSAAEQALQRAMNAGYRALVITIDTTVISLREREVRDGMEQLLRGSVRSRIPFLPQFFARPWWLARFLWHGGLPNMPNIVTPEKGELRVSDAHTAIQRASFSWEDMAWIRELWKGPIVIKGVMSAEDARRALDHGAAGIVVSNHGGRQLDGVPASLRILPEVVAVVNGRAEILLDGGVRSGGDVIKALCLGARAVLCGRAYAYGLAAAGEAGVRRALEILREDMERTIKLLGCGSVANLDSSFVKVPANWLAQ
jgi:isopentenyl diphosphate isomerase/L-lactate dehydrogenase-like FMN-dependent dehydrogenase